MKPIHINTSFSQNPFYFAIDLKRLLSVCFMAFLLTIGFIYYFSFV